MEGQKKPTEQTNTTSYTGPSHGPQGVDKAPGEEIPEDTVQFKKVTQKGKKVDADPSLESDQPADQSSLDESEPG